MEIRVEKTEKNDTERRFPEIMKSRKYQCKEKLYQRTVIVQTRSVHRLHHLYE